MSKRIRVILLIFSIIAVVALATYAWIIWNSPNNTELTMQIGKLAEVKFNKGNDISTSNMGPVLNPEVDGELTTFSVKNKVDYDYAIDININITSIANELKSESLKYMIMSSTTENGTYTNILSGNFANMVVGDNLVGNETIRANATTFFKFILYIDGTIENNTNMMGKAINATLNVTASVKEPNSPALTDNLIPVKYDDTQNSWVKADSSNTNNDWYNYNDKKWANAVLVSSTNRSTYVNGSVGTIIPESDVLAYYVWIPRYKYKVFNINKTIGVDSYNAQTTGIDIVFEKGTASTGTITCNYDFTITDGNLSERCSGTNGDYYTHPAFTF